MNQFMAVIHQMVKVQGHKVVLKQMNKLAEIRALLVYFLLLARYVPNVTKRST